MKPTILVIDDDEPILALMSNVLRGFGFNPIIASRGRDAIELATSSPPDVILVDLRMPGMSGEDVIRAMRADVRLGKTPILVLSGAPVSRDELAMLGADGAIQKPFDLEELIRLVTEFTTRTA